MIENINLLLQQGLNFQKSGDLSNAKEKYKKILEIDIDHAETNHLLGIISATNRDFIEAEKLIKKSLHINFNNLIAHVNYANILNEIKDFNSALIHSNIAIKLNSKYGNAYLSKGNALLGLRKIEDAADNFKQSIYLQPNSVDAYLNLGLTFMELGQYSNATKCFEKIIEIQPNHNFCNGLILHSKMLNCDWSNIDTIISLINTQIHEDKPTIEPFCFQSISNNELYLQKCATIFSEIKYPSNINNENILKKNRKNDQIHIGYLCGEFRQHATSSLMIELWESQDKNKFRIFALDNGWDDKSDLRKRIGSAFDEIIDISKLSDTEVIKIIKLREIDILINLNGFFGKSRQSIFAKKPCAIQVNFLGFPGTIGAKYMDYIIADEVVIPYESKQFYTEKIIYLPDCYQANDCKKPISSQTQSRLDHNLPENAFIYCCFNNHYKITPNLFKTWMNILKQVESSVLWLIENGPDSTRNLRNEAINSGIDPNRLIFAPRLQLPEHLARHKLADLFLDTSPYNAHTTASDALWAGLPLLTYIGKTFPGRVGASMLNAIGLPELVAPSQDVYENQAINFGLMPEKLIPLKNRLFENRLKKPLFNMENYVKNIQTAFEIIYNRAYSNLQPEDIYLKKY